MFTRIKNFFFKKLSQKKSLKPPSQEKKSSKSSFNSLSNSSLKSSPKDSSKESITESSKESSKDSDHTIDESLLLQKLSRMNIENPDNFNTLFIWSKKIIFEKRMLLNEVYEDYSLFNEIIDIFISFCEKVYFEYIKFNIYLKDHRNSIEREYKVLFGSKLLLGIIYI